jgi:hypothetical protein
MEWDYFTSSFENLIIQPESKYQFIPGTQETVHENINEMNKQVMKNSEFLKYLFMRCEQIKEAIVLEENSEDCLLAIKEIVNCIRFQEINLDPLTALHSY